MFEVFTDLKRRKLETLRMEEDCRSAEERLRADIQKLNQDRKRNVLNLKARLIYSLFIDAALEYGIGYWCSW